MLTLFIREIHSHCDWKSQLLKPFPYHARSETLKRPFLYQPTRRQRLPLKAPGTRTYPHSRGTRSSRSSATLRLFETPEREFLISARENLQNENMLLKYTFYTFYPQTKRDIIFTF